jgi:DNA-binding GntR family transcriptional regulator
VPPGPGPLTVRPVEVDRTSPVPLYFQVASRLQQLIESGEIPIGTRIENEIDFAERLGVSRPTTRRAIQYLVERGMLVRRRGVGTQVVHPKVRRPVELSSLYDDLAAAGRTPRTEIRTFEVRPASDVIAQALGITE